MTEQSNSPSLSRLIKLLKMTTSTNDPEALTAMRMANEEASRFGGWDTIMAGKITVIGDPFLDLKPPRRADSPPPPPPRASPPPRPYQAPQPAPAPTPRPLRTPPPPSQTSWAAHDAQLAAMAKAAGAAVDGNGVPRTAARAKPTITRPNDPPTAKQIDYALALASQAKATSINRNTLEGMTRQGVSNIIDQLRTKRTSILNPRSTNDLEF